MSSKEDGSIFSIEFESNHCPLKVELPQFALNDALAIGVEYEPQIVGGVLYGYYEGNIIYVTSLEPPPFDSIITSEGFVRGLEGVEERDEEVRSLHGGKMCRIGEWHTLPGKCAYRLSDTDEMKMRAGSEDCPPSTAHLLLVLGGDLKRPQVSCYAFHNGYEIKMFRSN